MKRSSTGGASWGELVVVHGESTAAKHVVIGNPAPVAVDTQPGKVVLVFCRNNNAVGVTASLDWGLTWATVRYIKSANPNGSWPWVATGPPQGIQLPSGRIVVGSDHHDLAGKSHFSHSMYSDDGGVHWAVSNSIAGGNEAQVAVLPNGTAGHAPGTLVIHMRNPTGQRLVAWSADGASWGPAQKVVVGGRTKYAVRVFFSTLLLTLRSVDLLTLLVRRGRLVKGALSRLVAVCCSQRHSTRLHALI